MEKREKYPKKRSGVRSFKPTPEVDRLLDVLTGIRGVTVTDVVNDAVLLAARELTGRYAAKVDKAALEVALILEERTRK